MGQGGGSVVHKTENKALLLDRATLVKEVVRTREVAEKASRAEQKAAIDHAVGRIAQKEFENLRSAAEKASTEAKAAKDALTRFDTRHR